MHTDRLYYGDSYLTAFQARVTPASTGSMLVYLDRTAFYPESGGQPSDHGELNGVPVVELMDEGERIAHRLASPLPETTEVNGTIDWTRRFDHMQQHTGQHLLSAVLAEQFGIATVSFHMGETLSTIDLATAALSAVDLARIEAAANEEVIRCRPVRVTFEDAGAITGLRKESERTGVLRVVEIDGLDRSACGGTHVRNTGEIGGVLLRRTEKVRDTLRLEFVCGKRATGRARADYEQLGRLSRLYSTGVDEVAAVAEAQSARLQEAEKSLLRLRMEVARQRGQAAWAAAAPDSSGVRRVIWRRGAIDDEVRAEAQGYAVGEKAVVTVVGEQPPALLIASSADSGVHAGNVLKSLVTAAGGRGGGGATLAQGSLPAIHDDLWAKLS